MLNSIMEFKIKRNLLLFILIIVSVVKSQDVDNGDAEQIDTHLAAEVGDITPNETDNKPAEYDVDTKNDPVPLPPAPPPVDTNTQGAAEIAPTKKPLGKKARSGKLLNGNPFDDSSYDPMTSRIAPNDQSSQQGTAGPPYVISAQRLDDIRKNFMYPYYDQGGNEDTGDYQKYIQSSTPQVHKNLNFQLPFFGFRFNYTRVSLNGYLEFSDPPPNYVYPLVFPVKEWPKKNDPSFIGIFFSKCRIGNLRDEDVDQRAPGVYFRLERDLRDRRDRMGVEIRERIKADIREGVIGADSFDPKHLIITTWKNISFNGGIGNALYTTNTFQMVLVTDEVFTYAMFNYQNLLWTSHTEAGGDTTNGEGGTSAFVGFNAGNGTRSHEYLPYSQASVIRDLTQTGFANNKSGRHIFRIDEDILLGSCNKDIDGANLKLNFAPESGNMLGGTIVNITGPCFNEYDEIRCKFDVADEVYGKVVDKNRAICIQPRLNVEGYVRLEIAVGSGPFKWKGKYYVETPSQATQKIFFKDMKQHEKSPGVIKMTWERYNLTTNTAANLQLSLWGYRETTIHPEFIFIRNLDSSMPNTGEYNIIPQNYRQNDDEFKTDVRFGFIQINYTESVESKFNGKMIELTPVVWSRPIPLGWYFGPQWERMYGSKWTEYLCNDWLRTDRYLKNFAHELPQCPCTLEQALADKGRFMPDFDCDKDSNPQCYYNNQAIHCVKTGSPTLEGSEQQCCYDKNKYLMLSYDQQWGSSPRRCHNVGLLPYNEATKVPTLSQWYNDMAPKYFCCLWQDEQSVGCETLRFERRPTQDCVAYQPPGIAGVYGDPHIVTFNDVPYTFNGKGEFVLTKSFTPTDNLEIQGRFEQMPMNAYGEVRATQLTSVAARGNSSTVIEVRSRPQESRWRYHMDVIADGKRVYFDRPSLKFQHFPGVTVYTPTYILNQSEVIIMFDNGVGVEVVENQGFMAARAYIPWSFINKTRGLFGNFSFGINDDFYLPDGRKVALDPNDSTGIYNDFGKEWILTDVYKENVGKSLFYREYGKTASNYNNVTFAPVIYRTLDEYLTPNKSALKEKVLQFCPENLKECIYDYALTENRDVAHFTSNYKASIFALKDTTKQTTVSCGILETPRFGRKSTFLFVPGTKVTFECNQEFVLIGDPRRTCLPSGQWDVPEYGYTECLRQQEYSSRNAAITGGIILAILIPLVLIIAYLGYKTYRKYMEKNEVESSWDYNNDQKDPNLKMNSRALSPTESDEVSLRSPLSSERSSWDRDSELSSKKRRSYEKTYRTNEPLSGVPEHDFNEGDMEEYEPETKPKQTEPSVVYSQPQGTPDLVPHGSPTYTAPYAKNRFSSQSSVVTDV